MYTQSSIDNVRDAGLLQVISRYVELTKTGANYKGHSPFKTEKTPSFVVSVAKNIWKCFATGQGGNDAISFVMEHEKKNFPEAVKTVAEICNIYLEEEQVSEVQQKKRNERQDMKALVTNVSKEYARQLAGLPETHWAKQMLESRGFTVDDIINFQIGWAPGGKLVSNAVTKNGKLGLAKDVGIVLTKQGVSYDFFFGRIVFPIQDRNGLVIGFGGRCSTEDEATTAKYINSRDSDIYKKDHTLYGYSQARTAIAKQNTAIVVEGYTDVIAMHRAGCDNTVATCGTALTSSHAKQLEKLCDHIIIMRDGDAAGIKACIRDIDMLLKTGKKISVFVCPDGEDPDSIAKVQLDMHTYVQDNYMDAIIWKTKHLLQQAGDNANDKAIALKNMVETLSHINSEIVRNQHVKPVASNFGESIRTVKSEIKAVISDRVERQKRHADRDKNTLLDKDALLGLPKGSDMEQFMKDRFAIAGNAYHFQGKSGFFQGTNFRMNPLFHIYGKEDNKRICEVINEEGQKRLIDFDSKDFINFTKIQETLIEEGFFIWLPAVNPIHFKLVSQKILNDFIMAYELKTLGWQKEGFFAFANGVYNNNQFQEVNKYGIIQIDTEEHKEGEYIPEVKHFYSPAYSEIYKNSRDDDDPYENDRSFIYKPAPITFDFWMQQMAKVYGTKGHIAIAFAVATMFRDHIVNRYSFFPHLFLSGEKGSGKSKYGDSISALFSYKLAPFDLNSGTIVGFYRRLARVKNVPVFFEEFHDKIDDRMFQSLKGAYDGRGREKGQMSNDNRTSVSKVNSSCILAGQYLSARDDNSLTSRSIIMNFIKPTEQFTDQQITDYNKLKEYEDVGLSSLVLDVIKHRGIVQQNFHEAFAKNSQKFKRALKSYEYQERMLMNYNALYTCVELLYKQFQFPFTMTELYQQCFDGILTNSDLIIESEGLQEFWNTLEKLCERGYVKNNNHFLLETPREINISISKNEKQLWRNTDRKRILYLRLNSVHQDYVNEVSKRDGVEVIGRSTMINYFKSKKYYIGTVKSKRFSDVINSSAYVFDYDLMCENGIVRFPESDPEDNPFAPEGEEPRLDDLFTKDGKDGK